MRYDILKCNNLRYKYDGEYGTVKVHDEMIVLLSDRTILLNNGTVERISAEDFYSPEDFHAQMDDTDFEIIPRDPNTYTDFQVGDKVRLPILEDEEKSDTTVYEVAARLNDVIFLANSLGVQVINTCTATKAKLILTDYERELANDRLANSLNMSVEIGDTVLVRDHITNNIWIVCKWDESSYYDTNEGRYVVTSLDESWSMHVKEMIPYNEKTYKLAGTKEDYNPEN